MPELVVVGAGGFGRETLDVVRALVAAGHDWHLRGVLDDAPAQRNLDLLESQGVAFLGSSGDFLAEAPATHYVIGVGSPAVRRRLADKFDAAGHQAATLIHPVVTLGHGVEVGEGSVLCAGARATTNIRLGRHVHLNPNVAIGHDTTLGDFVSVNPAGVISGDCTIEDGVLIGAAGVVLNQITVGAGSVVGASACVVKDVPPGVIVKGVPAR